MALLNGQLNTAASKSRLLDTDMAQESSNHSRNLILQEVNIAMQAQANLSQRQVLSLLNEG